MIPSIIALIILFATGATVVASDSARPGDFLFPVDRGTENVRMFFASDDKKTKLRFQFAKERVSEVHEIINEETSDDSDSDSAGEQTEIKAKIFTNETVIKIEVDDEKTIFVTDATDREAIIDAIVTEFSSLTYEEVDEVLVLENEDRQSRPEDKELGKKKKELSEEGRARIELGLSVAVTALEEIKSELELGDVDVLGLEIFDEVMALLNEELNNLPDNVLLEINEETEDGDGQRRVKLRIDDDKFKLDVRENGERIKIKIEEGKVRIEIKSDNRGSDDGDNDDGHDDDNEDGHHDDDADETEDGNHDDDDADETEDGNHDDDADETEDGNHDDDDGTDDSDTDLSDTEKN